MRNKRRMARILIVSLVVMAGVLTMIKTVKSATEEFESQLVFSTFYD